MDILLKISLGEEKRVPSTRSSDSALVSEIINLVQQTGGETSSSWRTRGGVSPFEIIVALGYAGAFTAIYRVIRDFLNKNKDREIKIERIDIEQEIKVTIKGHNLPEERELLEKILPEVRSQNLKTEANMR